jgi:hypothetical protein
MSWERIALALVLLVVGLISGAKFDRAQWDAEKLAQKDVVIQSQASTIATNQAQDAKAQKVDIDVKVKNQTVDGAVARLVSERDSLRDTLARVRADAMSEGATRARLAAELATASDSLGECSGRYSALAESHDRLSVQVTGLLELVPPD